jgi:hypothetical protein
MKKGFKKLSFHDMEAVVGTVTEEINDYLATRYWTLKKVTNISLLVTGP